MTNPNLTEIVCVIDRSGSMAKIKSDAIGGFNTFLKDQKAVGTPCKFTYVQFDEEYELVYDGINIQGMPPLNDGTFVPRGMTALYDAIGRTINAVGERLAKTPEDKRPGRVVFVILTDGLENASREFHRDRVFSMISTQRNEFNWEFVFLAANMDAQEVAASIGIKYAANFTPDGAHTNQIYANVSRGVTRHRKAAFCSVEMTKSLADIDDAVDVTVDPGTTASGEQ